MTHARIFYAAWLINVNTSKHELLDVFIVKNIMYILIRGKRRRVHFYQSITRYSWRALELEITLVQNRMKLRSRKKLPWFKWINVTHILHVYTLHHSKNQVSITVKSEPFMGLTRQTRHSNVIICWQLSTT